MRHLIEQGDHARGECSRKRNLERLEIARRASQHFLTRSPCSARNLRSDPSSDNCTRPGSCSRRECFASGTKRDALITLPGYSIYLRTAEARRLLIRLHVSMTASSYLLTVRDGVILSSNRSPVLKVSSEAPSELCNRFLRI